MSKNQGSFYYELALKWAPVNYQYINLSNWNNHRLTKKDLLVPVNMNCYRSNDNDIYKMTRTDVEDSWATNDIRNKLGKTKPGTLIPIAYYSIAEITNHLFVLYSFYHADDTTHPNDMEGCLVILEKIEENKQRLLGMMTVAHDDFWKYVYSRKKNFRHKKLHKMEVDEDLESQHPLIQQESGKHGLYALGDKIFLGTKIWRWFLALFNRYPDIVVYWPAKKSTYYNIDSLKRYKKTPHYPALYYELVDILDPQNGLWQRKSRTKNSTFQENGKFYGDKANPPWLWVENEREKPRLNMWENPAELAIKWFESVNDGKPFDTNYVRRMDGT